MRNILFGEIINRFYFKEKNKIYFLFLLSLIAGLFEYMGLVLIFWFILFLSNPNASHSEAIVFWFNNLSIIDNSKISLIFGISIAFIYIIKNLYMFLFVKYNNLILEDLSVKITLKMAKNILFGDFLTVNSFSNEEKINLIYKITIIIWFYCVRFVDFITNCLIATILLLYLFIKFTTVALVAFGFIGVLSLIEYLYLKKKSNYQSKNYTKIYNNANASLLKIINLTKEIRLNNKEEFYLNNVYESYKKFAFINQDRNFNSVFHIYFTEISIMVAFIGVLAVLFYSTNFDNQTLIATISTICAVILRLTPTLNRAQSALFAINSNKAAVVELLEFDDNFKNLKIDYAKEKMLIEKSIELKNINFDYKKENAGLKNINLKINKGEFIGIVGKSGCYKTTLSLILAGLILPDSGKILVDDRELLNSDIKKWQNNISLLSQDFEILTAQIENLDKDILNEFDIECLDVNKLSFGQKQRLAFLNLLFQDKEILILDEVTSASDVLNEEKISQIISKYKGQKTIILIAHRFQILKNCDKIIFMDKGEILDCGSFNELCEKYDEFKKMVDLSNFNL